MGPPLTSTIGPPSHPLEGASTDHAVVPTAAPRAIIGPGPLHAHGFAWGLVMRPDLSTTALENLYIPESVSERGSQE